MGKAISAFNGPELTPRQERVAVALAQGMSIKQASVEAEAGETTIKEWLKLPALTRRVREIRRELSDRAIGILAEAMTHAALTLKALLRSRSETVRHRAAESILSHGEAMLSLADITERLEEVEASTTEPSPHHNGRVSA